MSISQVVPFYNRAHAKDILGSDNVGMAHLNADKHLPSIRLMAGGQVRAMNAVSKQLHNDLTLNRIEGKQESFLLNNEEKGVRKFRTPSGKQLRALEAVSEQALQKIPTNRLALNSIQGKRSRYEVKTASESWRRSVRRSFFGDDEKGTRKVCTPGGAQGMLVISESGLCLIITSDNPLEGGRLLPYPSTNQNRPPMPTFTATIRADIF